MSLGMYCMIILSVCLLVLTSLLKDVVGLVLKIFLPDGKYSQLIVFNIIIIVHTRAPRKELYIQGPLENIIVFTKAPRKELVIHYFTMQNFLLCMQIF